MSSQMLPLHIYCGHAMEIVKTDDADLPVNVRTITLLTSKSPLSLLLLLGLKVALFHPRLKISVCLQAELERLCRSV